MSGDKHGLRIRLALNGTNTSMSKELAAEDAATNACKQVEFTQSDLPHPAFWSLLFEWRVAASV
ncbi:hypothetical protein ABTN58_19365, partial [Acinetobacter baumannii]